ncbi:MAG: hypothetical protein H3Z50_08035 [archaeon]|nr:hypothetical protein [archaeon]
MRVSCHLEPKYALGDVVKAKHFNGAEWIGEIYAIRGYTTGYYYQVSSCPGSPTVSFTLAEHEITFIHK